MSKTVQFPNGTMYRQEVDLEDALLIQDMSNLTKEPERTSVKDIKELFTGKIAKGNSGFVGGDELHHIISQIEKNVKELSLAGVSNLDDIPLWEYLLSNLFRVDIEMFNNLRYGCVLAERYVEDFPPGLLEYDNAAYVITHRNGNSGIQIAHGAESGFQYTRRRNNGKITHWTAVQGNGVYYATFEIIPATGELVMHTDPGYFGAGFVIENGNLTVIL